MSISSEWMNKLWYIHTMEYFSAIKRNELKHATTWMTIKNIWGVKETRYEEHYMILLTWKSREVKSIATENRSVLLGTNFLEAQENLSRGQKCSLSRL